jgi:hypothetical protein
VTATDPTDPSLVEMARDAGVDPAELAEALDILNEE